MLCWGYWSLGQPGISSNLQGIVAEPQVCGFISDRSVKEVACGGNHSVFLLEDGEVYTCGVNTKGQLWYEVSFFRENCYISAGSVEEIPTSFLDRIKEFFSI